MKQILAILAIIIVFIGLSLMTNIYLNNSSKSISSHLDNIDTYVKTQDWNRVHNEITDVKTIWSSLKNTWATIIEHNEIDKIEMSLAKVSEYAESNDSSEITAENSNLKLLIKHIPELYSLNIKNIL